MTKAIEYRRHLHKYPELGDDTVKTAEYIIENLKNLPCEISQPIPNSVCAWFDLGKRETAAFRSDMDALPVKENTGLKFASRSDGKMHACGHDGHMAMLLTFAQKIPELKELSKSNVLLIFQPAEETTGGAKRICETGIFEKYNVTQVFGFHIIPDIPKGVIASRPGALMAKSSEVTVDFSGVSAHIGRAHEGCDALYAATRFVCESYAAVENGMCDVPFKVLKFGKLLSGTARNAISASSHLEGSVRCFSQEDFVKLRNIVQTAAENAAAETGTTAKVHFNEGYLPVNNDAALFEKAAGVLDIEVLEEPRMIAEDFSYYQTYAPGVFLFLGSGSGIPLHSDEYDFDESILETGIDAYEKLLTLL